MNNKITIAVKLGNTADILIQPILPDCPLSGISFGNLPSFVLPYVNAINGNQYLSINGQQAFLATGVYEGILSLHQVSQYDITIEIIIWEMIFNMPS